MLREFANTTPIFYLPRHAAIAPRSALALARGFRAAIQGLRRAQPRHARRSAGALCKAVAWCLRAARWIAWKSDQPMSGAMMCLCGAIMGLIGGPLLIYCYFFA